MSVLARSISSIGLFAGLSSFALAGPITFTTIDDPLANIGTVATGINNAGQIVGDYYPGPNVGSDLGFLLDSTGTFTTITHPFAYGIEATDLTGINDSGQIVGYTYLDAYGFLDTGGTFTDVQDPLAMGTAPFGINNAGQIVGVYTFDASGGGFLDTGGTFTNIEDPSILGLSSDVTGINNEGQIVGHYTIIEDLGARRICIGFVDTGGTFTVIADPSAALGTCVQGINDSGETVGYYVDSSGVSHGFLDNGGIFTTIDDPLATGGTYPQGINNAGEIVGYYNDANGEHGFLATATESPEPSTFAMAIAAVLGIAGFRSCKRRLPS